jgi:hypothetical protein
MAIEITAIIAATSTTVQVTVRLGTRSVIADPATYVSAESVYSEILSRAGLDEDLDFIGAELVTSSTIGSYYIYTLTVTFGDAPESTLGHTHDYSTLTFPLRESYRDGPEIDLDSSLGPVIISYDDDTSVDYLRIKTDTATTARDLLYLYQGSILRLGTHLEFFADNTYDVGTPDAGVTLRRPRDLRIGRNLYAGGNATLVGYGSFGSYLLSTYNQFTAQAANPDTGAGIRHIYVNSTDDSIRYWDGTSETILSGGAGASGDTVGLYNCPAGVVIGDAVYVTGANTVGQADAGTLAGNPIVGIVVSKPTAVTCAVKYTGEAAVFAGLSSGKYYYVQKGVPGGIIDTVAGINAEGDTQVRVGFAKNATTLAVRVGDPLLI